MNSNISHVRPTPQRYARYTVSPIYHCSKKCTTYCLRQGSQILIVRRPTNNFEHLGGPHVFISNRRVKYCLNWSMLLIKFHTLTNTNYICYSEGILQFTALPSPCRCTPYAAMQVRQVSFSIYSSWRDKHLIFQSQTNVLHRAGPHSRIRMRSGRDACNELACFMLPEGRILQTLGPKQLRNCTESIDTSESVVAVRSVTRTPHAYNFVPIVMTFTWTPRCCACAYWQVIIGRRQHNYLLCFMRRVTWPHVSTIKKSSSGHKVRKTTIKIATPLLCG
jgi:hypothetical protein